VGSILSSRMGQMTQHNKMNTKRRRSIQLKSTTRNAFTPNPKQL
jgi:hypothetical protein